MLDHGEDHRNEVVALGAGDLTVAPRGHEVVVVGRRGVGVPAHEQEHDLALGLPLELLRVGDLEGEILDAPGQVPEQDLADIELEELLLDAGVRGRGPHLLDTHEHDQCGVAEAGLKQLLVDGVVGRPTLEVDRGRGVGIVKREVEA